MEKPCFVGFDTSNYTTSMAACDEDGKIIANVKMPLQVKEGQRGLRQSDALFLHTKNLSEIYDKFGESTKGYAKVLAVGASEKPRDVQDSYMPCFLAGRAAACGYANALNVPKYFFSHQDGHIMAALYSAANPENSKRKPANLSEITKNPFVAFHVSGGTTEILYVDASKGDFEVSLIGGTSDLNAGQAVDRTGVMMGLKFPCGAEMEKLALANEMEIPKPHASVKELTCCLSGLENLSSKLYKETKSREATSLFVFEYVADTLDKMTKNLLKKYGNIPIIYAGGVMSNSIIQERLAYRNDVYFASPMFSADNAAGIALLCRKKYMELNS